MAISIETTFIVFSSIIFLGYLGEKLSHRLNVPSAVFLLALGYLLKLSGAFDISAILGIREIFGGIALVILLFDGGISLGNGGGLSKSGRGVLTAILITALSIIGLAAFFKYVMGVDPLIGAILGAIAGGIGSTTTISIIKSLSLPKDIGDFVTVEASMTDVFSVILTVVMASALVTGVLEPEALAQSTAARFLLGLGAGLMVGFILVVFLSKTTKHSQYMILFAATLALYALVELGNGSGAFAVLVCGIMFANQHRLCRLLHIEEVKKKVFLQEMHAEISFIVRTFFFVLLGIMVDLGDIQSLLYGLGIITTLYAVRFIVLKLTTWGSPLSQYSGVLTAVNPRGITTAVLVTYVIQKVADALSSGPDARLETILLQMEGFPEISLYIIIFSIVFTSVLVPIAAKRVKSAGIPAE
ncbi:MAG: cation:proton antiporter [Candidatus Micrarchaeota archaeon]